MSAIFVVGLLERQHVAGMVLLRDMVQDSVGSWLQLDYVLGR